jgi:hypothetical protein
MAFDKKPTTWIANWSEDGTNITFPLASLDQPLTAAEADGTEGDWLDCFFSLVDHTYQHYNSLASADKPTKLTISRTGAVQPDGSLLFTYTIRAYTNVASADVISES